MKQQHPKIFYSKEKYIRRMWKKSTQCLMIHAVKFVRLCPIQLIKVDLQ